MDYSFWGRNPPTQLTAMAASFNPPIEQNWHANSGATNCITNYLNKLSLHSGYQGNEQQRLVLDKVCISVLALDHLLFTLLPLPLLNLITHYMFLISPLTCCKLTNLAKITIVSLYFIQMVFLYMIKQQGDSFSRIK